MSEDTGIGETQPDNANADENKSANYHERILAEPDFAKDEVVKKDRYIGQLTEKYNKLKDLETYVEAAGNVDELVKLATEGYQARQEKAATPPTPTPPVQMEEEIFDPEVKAIDAKYDTEVAQLKAANMELMARLNKTEVASMQGALQTNIESALSRFGDDQESVDAAAAELSKAVKQYEQAAANGDRTAQATLDQLAGPMGTKALRMMTLDIYDQFVEKQLSADRETQNSNDEVMRLATDTPNTVRGTPEPSKVVVTPGARVTAKTFDNLLSEVARKSGKDPDKLFG